MQIAVILIILVGGLLDASAASAQIASKTKLGLDVNAFTFASYDSGPGSDAITELQFGPFATEVLGSTSGLPPAGLELGYGVTDAVLVGALLRLGVSSVDDSGGGSSESIFTIGILPHVDYVMSHGRSFRPYIGMLAGLTTSSGSLVNDQSITFASIGAEIGGYGFVGSSLSIGPRLAVTYSPGISDVTTDTKVLAVQFQIEIAGWL